MTSAEGQVSLSDLRVKSRTSIDATRSAGYAMCVYSNSSNAHRTTRTRRKSGHVNEGQASCSEEQ